MCAHQSSGNYYEEPSEDFRALSYKLAVLASLDSPVCLLSSRKQPGSAWIPPAFSLETTGNLLGQMYSLDGLFSVFLGLLSHAA